MKVKNKTSSNLTAFSIIQHKVRKKELSAEQINFFINEMVQNRIEDAQVSALLMALYLNGMSQNETDALTDAMLHSGVILPVPSKNTIDKHSTGGVGDKTSFILAPIAAAAGVLVPMIAGRGLGHTGGTVDKIESIAGFKTSMSLDSFQKQLQELGIVLIGQTADIAPADKKIYALRDVTATIDHVGLITASIMSKKLAGGANGYVLDIKLGNGAFMKNIKDAKTLAKSLVRTSFRFKKKAIAFITDMNQPLGVAIGHTNEMIECIEILKGKNEGRLKEISLQLAAAMIYLAGKASSLVQARKIADDQIKNGNALKLFRKMIVSQGGNEKIVNDYSLLPQAKSQTIIKAPKSGWLSAVDTSPIGTWLIEFGGGRKKKSDIIDHSVGFEYLIEIGQHVKKGEAIFIVHHHDHQKDIVKKFEKELLSKILKFSATKSRAPKLIHQIISK